jgi:hypothetical protein
MTLLTIIHVLMVKPMVKLRPEKLCAPQQDMREHTECRVHSCEIMRTCPWIYISGSRKGHGNYTFVLARKDMLGKYRQHRKKD